MWIYKCSMCMYVCVYGVYDVPVNRKQVSYLAILYNTPFMYSDDQLSKPPYPRAYIQTLNPF